MSNMTVFKRNCQKMYMKITKLGQIANEEIQFSITTNKVIEQEMPVGKYNKLAFNLHKISYP